MLYTHRCYLSSWLLLLTPLAATQLPLPTTPSTDSPKASAQSIEQAFDTHEKGVACFQKQSYEEAIVHLKKSYQTATACSCPPTLTATIAHDLALAYAYTQSYEVAMPYYITAYSLYQEKSKHDPRFYPLACKAKHSLASVCYHAGKIKKAEKHYFTLLIMYLSDNAHHTKAIRATFDNLFYLYNKSNHPSQAIIYSYLRKQQKSYHSKEAFALFCYQTLALLYEKSANYPFAITAQKGIVQALQKKYPTDDLRIADADATLGHYYQQDHQPTDAMHYYRQALSRYESQLGMSHPKSIQLRTQLLLLVVSDTCCHCTIL